MKEHLFHEVYGTRGTPYGSVYANYGDRLFVQEGVIKIGHERRGRNGQYLWPKLDASFTEEVARDWFDKSCLYTADLRHDDPAYDEPHGTLNKMFMPRWAARTVLELTDVNVEQLNEISSADAIAEGIEAIPKSTDGCTPWKNYVGHEGFMHDFGNGPIRSYRSLWESINGEGSWSANPWVWALSFKKVTT